MNNEEIMEMHSKMLDEGKSILIITDTGSLEEGMVAFTICAPKKKITAIFEKLQESHKHNYK